VKHMNKVKEDLLRQEDKKREFEALKAKKKEIDEQLRHAKLEVKLGEASGELRPLASSLRPPPHTNTTHRVEQGRNTHIGPNPGSIKPIPTHRVDKPHPQTHESIPTHMVTQPQAHYPVVPPTPGSVNAKLLRPFDPNMRAPKCPPSRGGTPMSRARTPYLQYSPPSDAFRITSSDMAKPQTPNNRASISRLSRNVQGVASREIKTQGSEVLALVHDDTASEYRKMAKSITDPAWKPLVDRHTIEIDKFYGALEQTREAMSHEVNPDSLNHRVSTAQVEQETAAHNTSQRNGNIYSYGEGKPYPKHEDEDKAAKYNKIVQVLKTRMYQRGSESLSALLNCKDIERNGALSMADVKEVLEIELNLPIQSDIAEQLIDAVAKKTDDGKIVIQDFVNKLRTDKISYVEQKPPSTGKKRLNPDFNLPFGNPDFKVPFGIMSDSLKTVSSYDKKIRELFGNLKQTFEEFDQDGTGLISWKQFRAAMERIDAVRDLKLADTDIQNLFRKADRNRSGSISYEEFIKSFAVEGGVYSRFLPEFMKPRAARCSIDQPKWWTWKAYDPHAKEVKKIGSRSFDQPNFARVPTPGSRLATPAPYAMHPSAMLEACMRY